MLDDKVHDALFSDTTVKLGEIHWMLLKSSSVMAAKRWTTTKGPIGHIQESTDFGKEVGIDEIHWWVFERETDVDELSAQTQVTLDSVQVLKDAATQLKSNEPKSYRQLLQNLKEFAEQHSNEIDIFHRYVNWLMKRDIMAPRILFTYRVWGSTRMSDRELNVDDQDNPHSDPSKLRALTEIVLGVRDRLWLVYDKLQMEIGFAIFDNLDPEELAADEPIPIPEKPLIRRTAYAVYENCLTYFTEIRDSLRNILLDIEKFKEQRTLFESDEFWREFIIAAISAKTCESQLWDFKETLTIWYVKNDPAKRKAQVRFAEDVASFANTTGGVLIVGVNDKRQIVGVGSDHELESRLKVAADVIARFIEYDRDFVSFRQIVLADQGKERICLIIVVSQACSAVAVSNGDGQYTYPVRRETGISREGRNNVPVGKLHLKNDNRDFMHQLRRFIRDS